MTERKFLFVFILLLLTAICNQLKAQGNASIVFIENRGQWPEQVKFFADIPGGKLFIENNTLTYSFDDPEQAESRSHNTHLLREENSRQNLDHYAIKVNFLDADKSVEPMGLEPDLTRYN